MEGRNGDRGLEGKMGEEKGSGRGEERMETGGIGEEIKERGGGRGVGVTGRDGE